MADVLDIIAKLSLDVEDEALKRHIKTFKDLNRQVDDYNYAIKQGNKDDIANQRALQAELARTKQARDNVGNAIVAQVNNSKRAQEAVVGEIKSINELTAKLESLKRARNAATSKDALNIYKQSIAETEGQIKAMTGSGANGIFGSLFSMGGSAGTQVINGILRGFAVGSGFGIITRLTDEVIKLGETFFDVDKRELDLAKNTETLEKSFDGLGETLIKLNHTLSESILFGEDNPLTQRLYTQSIDGLKRRAAATKALGVEQDKQLAAERNQLNADQAVRVEEKKAIENDLATYQKVVNILKTQTTGDERLPLATVLKKNNIPKAISAQLQADINEARSKNVNPVTALAQVQAQYEAKFVEQKQKSLDKQQEIEDAQTAFTAKQVQAQYKLQVSLLRELRKEQEEYSVAILKDVFDTSKIKQDAELKELEITKQREKDEHGLSLANLEAYEQKRQSIERKYALERQEFILKQEAFFKDLSISILQSSIQTSGELLKLDVAPAADDFIQIVKQKNELLDKEQQKFADKLRSDANGNRELEIKAEEEISHKKELIVIEQNNNIIDSYKQFYARLSQLITEQENSILIKQGLSTSERADALSSRYAKYRISEALYRNLQQQVTLQAAIQTDKTKFGGTAQQLTAAIATQQNIVNNPNSTGKQIQDAKNQIELLQTELNNLDKDINEKSRNLHQLRIESIFIEIDAYKQLVDSAVSAYSAINAAHQKYLEAEISIQGERVREAEVLANRGNTTALKQQQETLNKLEQQKELYARREMIVNSALALSNAVLAIAKAAAEGGGLFSVATVAATIAALTAGYAAVSNLNSPLSQPGFAKGGYTGDGGKNDTAGVVHKGEFVFNKETTAKYRPMFEAIHKYGGVPVMNEVFASGNKKTDDSIVRKLDEVTDAIKENRVRFGMHVDKSGFGLHVEEMIRANNNRFRG